MRVKLWVGVIVCMLAAASTAFADVQLTIQNGRVSLVAKDVTVRQILTEWARVGQTKIVNLERVPGGPVTLQLTNVPEQQALDVLLRSVSGYLAAPRPTFVENASVFDRIVVMPTSVPPSGPTVAPPPTFSPPPGPAQFGVPQVQPPQQAVDGDGDEPATNVPAPNRGPAPFRPFAQPQVVNPQAPAVPTALPGVVGGMPATVAQPPVPAAVPPTQTAAPYPGAPTGGPIGVAVPGMVVPAPQTQQPGQPGQVPPGTPQGRR